MALEEDPEQHEHASKKKKSDEEYEKRKKNITPGSLMKAMIRSGEGTTKPVEGDQVIFHCTIRTVDGVIVNSTRSEHGGKGYPNRYILGKSKMLLGLCEGLPTMLKSEIAMFKMKPELHYAEVDCPVSAPEDFPKDVDLHFEIEILDFFKAKARLFGRKWPKIEMIVSEDMGVVKKIIDEGQGWECPRELYEVQAWITAKATDGKIILPRMNNPYHFTFGKSEIPKGLEMGIGTMAKREKAVIFVNDSYLTNSSLIQIPEGHVEVQFEVELVHFTQVRDMLGDGRLIKRRIRDGKERKSTNPEVKLGLYHCIERLIPDLNVREIADLQLVLFRNREGFFGLQAAKSTIAKRSPVEWWIQFGDSTPELRSFAVRVLGLTCSFSGCERNWSTYSQVQTKRRNRLSTLRMNSLVYIMHNKRLRDRRMRNKGLKDDEDPLVCEDVASNNEWFIDDETDLPSSEDLSVDVLRGEADLVRTPHTSTSSAAQQSSKGEFPMDCPLQDSLLRVHYKGLLLNEERTVFYDTRVDNNGEPLEFCSGEGLVPEGFEMCVRLMLPGEISVITCPPDYAYDKFKRPANVPEAAHVQWEIELLGFEMPKDWTGLNFQNIMDEVEKIKNTVLREYNHVNPQDDEEGKTFLNSRNALHLNVAACYQKMGEYRKSIETCNKVLDGNPVHVKAIYRRGMAYMLNGDFEEARNDFNAMISMDKSSEPDANAALQKLKQLELENEKKARKQFKGLFDKKPGEISEAGNKSTENQDQDSQSLEGNSPNPDEGQESPTSSVDAGVPAKGLGFLSRLWPSGRRIFAAFGSNRCSIL
ncbi:hypothetical protein IEQ34_012356 [Dendrobium chrysotoxum]|uniref:peptidylprolyl isomerase n=1 Tax=Dendrobium chrysotoxum TaxID=161865 RepID=A0AAV7GVF4_DENCH|nr:hypothetical protein IEQ34_012356 [Dendrobium chrysotoxum]